MSEKSAENKPAVRRISAARKELIHTYAQAAACLYGALSLTEFVDVFNHYEDAETELEEATLALRRYAKVIPIK